MDRAQNMLRALKQSEVEKAKEYFAQVANEGTEEEQFFLAEQLFGLGMLDEAEALYQILLTNYKDEGELLVRIAEIAIEKDDLNNAQDYLEKVKEDDEAYLESLLVLADLYQIQGLFEVSEQKLLKAKNCAPDEPIVDFALGEYYLSQGRFATALQSYETLLEEGITEINEGAISIYKRMAESLSASGAFEKAIFYYEKALLTHESADLLFELGFTSYQAKEHGKVIRYLERLREIDPSYTTLYSYLSRSYNENREFKKALEVLKDGLKYDEFNKELFFEAGETASKLQLFDEAEQFFRQAIVLDEEYERAILALNKLLFHLGKYEEIIELFESLPKEAMTEPQIYWDLSVAYQELEQYPQAKKNYERAYQYFQTNPLFLREYGLFMRSEGEILKAKESLRLYLNYEPDDLEIINLMEE